MQTETKWFMSEQEKDTLIAALTPELAALRMKADISQGELANLIGVSRQTYGAIERGDRQMSWNTYLSLILFYDYNKRTSRMLHALGAAPTAVIRRFNDGAEVLNRGVEKLFGEEIQTLADSLDQRALDTIRTVVMLEYARCMDVPGEAVIKSFDGKRFDREAPPNREGKKALKAIKERQSRDD